MERGRGVRLGATVALLLVGATVAKADCLSLKSGPIVYDVAGCKQIEPETMFDLKKEKYEWIAGLDAAGKKKLYDSYRGLYMKGKVVKSQATQKGIASENGVLGGETVYMYLPPGGTCNAVLGKRLSGNLKEICCDGGGDPPCLLDTSYLLLSAKTIGAASSGAGDSARQKAKKSKDYAAGVKAYKEKKYKDAVAHLEKARTNDELDITGYYLLGHSFRELDQCKDAIGPLKYVHEQREKKAVWADEEPAARAAVFLLARCYSKMNEPGSATLLLNSYLLEPSKYKKELQESLTHKDFGWIHTSKEYKDYEKEAKKKLNSLK